MVFGNSLRAKKSARAPLQPVPELSPDQRCAMCHPAQQLSIGAVPNPCTPAWLQLRSDIKWYSTKANRLKP